MRWALTWILLFWAAQGVLDVYAGSLLFWLVITKGDRDREVTIRLDGCDHPPRHHPTTPRGPDLRR